MVCIVEYSQIQRGLFLTIYKHRKMNIEVQSKNTLDTKYPQEVCLAFVSFVLEMIGRANFEVNPMNKCCLCAESVITFLV